jgi:GAF domain-containing protein
VGHREETITNLSIALNEGVTGTAAAQREPILVGDVRNDPRYLNAVDAVRTELAVPMTARGKLVGVIDLQSTRVNAYTEYDRALMRLIAGRVGIAIDNARLYRRAERQKPHPEDAGQHLARVLVDPRPERTAPQDLQHDSGADQLRRVQHSVDRSRCPGAATLV